MAWELPLFKLPGFVNHVSMASNYGHAVKIDPSTGKIDVCGAGEASVGVMLQTDGADVESEIGAIGVYEVIVGSAGCTINDELASDASGHFVTATSGDNVIGKALETGASGAIIAAFIAPRLAGVLPSGTQGKILYHNGTNWVALAVGTDGQVLTTQGAAANPAWKTPVINHEETFIVDLNAITTSMDILTNYTPGYAGRIVKIDAVCFKKVTTGAKGMTINAEIGTVDVTGGVLALTSSNLAAVGSVVAGSIVTGTNVFTKTDSISLEATSVTQFSEGWVMIKIQTEEDVLSA